jgi:hypothetical protein
MGGIGDRRRLGSKLGEEEEKGTKKPRMQWDGVILYHHQ